jgi:hypothetical protein
MSEVIDKVLCDEDLGGTNVKQRVSYSPKFGVTISGSDFGDTPRSVFGSSEYEYWRSVKPEHVERLFNLLSEQTTMPTQAFSGELLLELICDRFGGDHNAEKRFREWCEANEVPVEFYSWSSGF